MSLFFHGHLRNLFKREEVQRSNCTPLPVELWEHIASMLKTDKGDLARLCRTSQTLRAICEPHLYRSITIRARLGQLESLSSTILNPRLANLITAFHISFLPTKIRRQNRKMDIYGRIDKLAGQVLISLRNLQTLEHRCDACDSSTTCHQYLRHLETRKLINFTFIGSDCYLWDPTILLEIFASPCMNTVRVLTWDDSSYSPLNVAVSKFGYINPAELILMDQQLSV